MGISRLAVALIAFALATGQSWSSESSQLSGFPFYQPGEYEFHFRQAHRKEMTLLLKLDVTVGESRRAALERLQTVMDVSLADHSGRSVCTAIGSPAKGVTKNSWVLMTSAHEAAFWHFSCREIKLKRSERYTLKIRIRDVDPDTPKIRLTPVFQRSDDFWP